MVYIPTPKCSRVLLLQVVGIVCSVVFSTARVLTLETQQLNPTGFTHHQGSF